MYTIRVDLSDIGSMKKRFQELSEETDNMYRQVSGIAAELEMEVGERNEIYASLQNLTSELLKLRNFFSSCAKLAGESTDEFAQAEKIDRLPDLNFPVIPVANGKNSIADRISEIRNEMIMRVTSISSALFAAVKSDNTTVKITDHAETAEYFESEWADDE